MTFRVNQSVNQSLAKTAASVNYPSARPPRLIQIDAPFSSRLSRDSLGSKAPFWQSVGHFRSTPMNRHHQSRLACLKRAMDRDRGEPRGSSPPTPPYVRVRIRRFEKLR